MARLASHDMRRGLRGERMRASAPFRRPWLAFWTSAKPHMPLTSLGVFPRCIAQKYVEESGLPAGDVFGLRMACAMAFVFVTTARLTRVRRAPIRVSFGRDGYGALDCL